MVAVHLVGAIATFGLSVANPTFRKATVAVGAPESVRTAARPLVAGLLVCAVYVPPGKVR